MSTQMPTISVEEIDNRFVATIADTGATVSGSTHDEALQNALREIIARQIAQAEERKKHRRKDHTGA
jgi:hypothetical protein